MLNSLRSRLLASYVLIIVVCLVLVGIVTFFLLQGYRISAMKAGLAERSVPAAIQIRRFLLEGRPLREIEALLQEQTASSDVRVLVVDQRGKVLADSHGELTGQALQVRLPALIRSADPNASKIRGQFRAPSGETFVYGGALVPPPSADSARRSWVILASPLGGGAYLLEDLTRRLLVAGGAALLVSIIVAAAIAQSIARPIRQITEATERVAEGSYDLDLDIRAPDEVGRLAVSFSAMTQEVAASRQVQRDFLANVSHELRTPLTSIRGFAQAILDGAADDQESQHRAAEIIHTESERMIRMVEDLLDLAKIEAGQIVMEQHPIDLYALIENTAKRFMPQAKSADVTLRLALEPTPPLNGDGDRLVQVVTNLIDNALRHTPAGGEVTVSTRSVPATGETPQIAQVSVTDTGAGVPHEELDRLFERFYQVDKSRAKEKSGTGLGLAIVKEIVEAHGGKIHAESVEGLVTRFVVELPS